MKLQTKQILLKIYTEKSLIIAVLLFVEFVIFFTIENISQY